MSEPRYCIGSCCPAAVAAGRGSSFAEVMTEDGRVPDDGLIMPGTQVREFSLPPRNYSVAAHEAGHAVVGTLKGLWVISVEIDVPSQARFDLSRAPSKVVDVMQMIHAGCHAGYKADRIQYLMPDTGWQFFIDAVRAGTAGQCDQCRAARQVIDFQPDVSDRDAIDTVRHYERKLLDLLAEPRVWAAVRRLAARLMEVGHVDGDEVRRIVADLGLPIPQTNDKEQVDAA